MKRTGLTLLTTALTLAALAWAASNFMPTPQAPYSFYPQKVTNPSLGGKPLPGEAKATGGHPEDPYGRWRQEQRMLRDPKTGRIPELARLKALAYARELAARQSQRKSSVARSQRLNTLNLTNRGPRNVGGRTRALAIDVSNENIILAGGVSGGMWRSTDGGNNWQRTTALTDFPSVTCIVQDTRPGKTNNWYYGSGEIFGNSATLGGAFYRGDGVFHSQDGGQTWTPLPFTSTGNIAKFDNNFKYVNNLAIDPSNTVQDEIYAAVVGGIIRSTDGLASGQFVLGGPINQDARFTDVAVTENGTVYAAISNLNEDGNPSKQVGLYRSVNGVNWENITPNSSFFTNEFFRVTIGIAPSNNNIVYFLGTNGENGNSNNVLFRYNAATGAMEDRRSAIPTGEVLPTFDPQGSYNMFVRVHPNDPDIVYIGGTNLYRSTNGFSTRNSNSWQGGYNNGTGNGQSTPNHHPDQHDLVFFPSTPNKAISAHDGGLSLTNDITASDFVSWTSLNNAYLTTQFYTLDIEDYNEGDVMLVGGLQDNSTYQAITNNPAHDWVDIGGGDGSFCANTYNSVVYSFQVAGMRRYGFNDTTGVQISTQNIDPPNQGNNNNYLFINPFTYDPVDPDRFFVASRGRVHYTNDVRTINSSQDWQTLGSGIVNSIDYVSALGHSTFPIRRLYFGTDGGRMYRVLDTADPDNTLEEITGSNFPADSYISCIAVDPADANKVFAVFSNYNVESIFYSEDAGNNWEAISGNLDVLDDEDDDVGPSVRWLAIMENGTERIYYAATNTGLYATDILDGSRTDWIQIGADVIGNAVVSMVRTRAVDGYVAVSTHGNGVFDGHVAVPFQPKVFFKGNLALCGNTEVRFRASRSVTGMAYQWKKDGQPITGENNFYFTSAEAGVYSVEITSAVLNQTVEVGGFEIDPSELPDNTLTVADDVNLSVPPCSGCTYQWFNNDGIIEDATDNTLTIPADRTNSYRVLITNGCGALFSETYSITAIDNGEDSDVVLYPNPNTGKFLVQVSGEYITGKPLVFTVFDELGRKVKEYTMPQNLLGTLETEVDISQERAGTYMLMVSNGERKTIKRFIKQ